MKCGYKYCKLGGEVAKEDAVKVGGRYWHKECSHERDIKTKIREYYQEHFNSREPVVAINKAISKYVHEQNYDVDYVFYCLKHKVKNLNSLYGLSYTLSYKQNEKDFKKMVAKNTKIVYNQPIENDFFKPNEELVKKKSHKRWEEYFD